jgi:hypothetical protein
MNEPPSPFLQKVTSYAGILGTVATIAIYWAAKDSLQKIEGFQSLLNKNDSLNTKIYDMNLNVVHLIDSISKENKIMKRAADSIASQNKIMFHEVALLQKEVNLVNAHYEMAKKNDETFDISEKVNLKKMVKDFEDYEAPIHKLQSAFNKIEFSRKFWVLLNKGENNPFLIKNKDIQNKWKSVKKHISNDIKLIEDDCLGKATVTPDCINDEKRVNKLFDKIYKEYKSLIQAIAKNLK